MASSGNFSTMNPLHRTSTNVQYSNGNLTFSPNSSWSETTFTRNNMVIPKDKKIYMEVHCDNQSGDYHMFGVSAIRAIPLVAQSGGTGTVMIYNGSTRINGTRTDNVVTNPAQGSIVGIAIDGSNNKVWFAVNNTWQLSGDPSNGTNELGTVTTNGTVGFDITFAFNQNSASILTANFGQDSTFAGQKTAGGNADANGFGDFYYAPPTGFLALTSANLSLETELDPAEENQPAKYFDAVAYTGNGSTQNITGLGFQPDITLIKNRDQTDSWCHQNSTLGVGKTQAIDTAAAVASETDCVTAFNSDGFSLGNNHKVNASSENYIAYCWKKSADAGLDIVTYSGDGSTQAISHNLGVTPTMIWIFLNTGSNLDSICYIDSNNAPSMGTGNGIFMSLPNGKQASTYVSATSSSSFSVTSSANSSGRTYFAYVFAEKEGFSKFIEYEGNGNSDGPFIHNNFLGKLNIIKAIDSSQMWATTDTVRETFNPLGEKIIALDNTYAEFDASGFNYDMVSNGMKIRSSDTNINSSASFLSLSWASVPFKYNNTF